jgi:hypothetical protein
VQLSGVAAIFLSLNTSLQQILNADLRWSGKKGGEHRNVKHTEKRRNIRKMSGRSIRRRRKGFRRGRIKCKGDEETEEQ